MTTKTKTDEAAVPVTVPAVPADEAFGNVVIAARDASVVMLQKLKGDLLARNSQYERDSERLRALWQAEADTLADQISRHDRIIEAGDAAIEKLEEGTEKQRENVVPLKAATAQ